MKESTIENDILQYLNYMGGYFWRTHDSKHRPCTPGIPDIMGVLDGTFYAIEVKKPGGKMAKEQDAFFERIRQHGAVCAVAQSVRDAQVIISE